MSSIEAFRYVISHAEGKLFTESFLSSFDFDQDMLKEICRNVGIAVSGKRTELIQRIVSVLDQPNAAAVMDEICNQMITRRKNGVTFKRAIGIVPVRGKNPQDLLLKRGVEEWYGPISRSDDTSAYWYIRPLFLQHYENGQAVSDESSEVIRVRLEIRWLCFARVHYDKVSLHWHGFSYQPEDQINPQSRSQFPYWKYIPSYFQELEAFFGVKFVDVDYRQLVLDAILEKYRRDINYSWSDDRIRAEAGGVSLNARAGGSGKLIEAVMPLEPSETDVLDTEGLMYLATTIRRAIEYKLRDQYEFVLPDPNEFDEEILITLIKRYDTQSYGLTLQDKRGRKLFHSHCYFGSKPHSNTADSFPHFQFRVSDVDDLEQLRFLYQHLG